MPWDGWWGFAALADAPEKMKSPGGEDADIELGAVIWIKAERGN
jgi:cobalt/nickel transport protein